MRNILLILWLLTSLGVHAQENTGTKGELSSPFTISGYAEGYYSVDLNNSMNHKKPSFFVNHNKNDEVSLNLAFIKGSYDTENIRANLALGLGSYMRTNYAAESSLLKNLYEGNIGVLLLKENNVWLDVGIFTSHIGFENAIGKEHFNLTRSMQGENTPYFEAGTKISSTSNDGKLFLSALILSGWQRIQPLDGNTLPAFGTQITYKPSSRVTLNSSTFIGTDKPDNTRKMRYLHDFYAFLDLQNGWDAIVGFDIGAEQKDLNSSAMNIWFNPTLILRYELTEKAAIAVRTEYYNDKNGVIIASETPNGFKTWGFSTNFDYHITKNLIWRIEARALTSKDKVFGRHNGNTADTNTFLTTALAINF
ncbi:MAG: porin [Nitrosomonadaceae bacterium]|nr:porin [Nitrosomonadaceae bacterium]